MQQIRRPPRTNTPVRRALFNHWSERWELYTHYRGERIGTHRRLPVLHDAVMAYRLGDGDYLKFGHFVFAA